jgi:uncharacterized protein DUF1206
MTPRTALRLELFARAGFAARGAVYCLVGGLALLAAIGSGGDVGGGQGALRSLLGQPFGAALLLGVGVGLAFFAVWRIVEAATDADGCGSSTKGLATRAVHALSGLVNGGLAVSAISLALGLGLSSGGDDQAAQDWTEWALAHPFGRWAVAAVGIGVIVGGVIHLLKGWRGDVLKRLSVPPAREWLARNVGRAGYAARGVTFILIGGFLALAALHGNSAEAKGLGGALQSLESQPYGWALLGAVALGLFAFGAFGIVQALYRRIRIPDLPGTPQALQRA